MSDSSFFSSPSLATPSPAPSARSGVAAPNRFVPASAASPDGDGESSDRVPLFGSSSLLGIGGGAYDTNTGIPMGGRALAFDSSANTPMPGALSFTPAISHTTAARQRAGPPRSALPLANTSFFATPAQPPPVPRFGRGLAPPTVASAQATPLGAQPQHRFTTTPSVPVPLDFPLSKAVAAPRFHAAGVTGKARANAAAMQFPDYRPHANKAGAPAATRAPLPLSAYASGLPSSAGGQSSGAVSMLQLAHLLGDQGSFGAVPSVPSSGNDDVRIARAPLRALISSCLARGHMGGAIFYADKLATLEGFSPASVLHLATAYARDGQHQRAVHLLRKHNLMSLPTCPVAGGMAQWRRDQLEHEQKQARLAQQQALHRRTRRSARTPQVAALMDQDVQEASPLTLRMECLYQGLQSLLEMGAHEEALKDSLPERHEETTEDANADAPHWERLLTQTLAAIAPVQASSDATRSMDDADAIASSAAQTVREIIGSDEAALIRTLLQYHALQREVQARTRQRDGQQQQLPGTPMQDDASMSECDDDNEEEEMEGPIDVGQHADKTNVYESQSNRYKAVLWYKLCLRFDVRHLDAFERMSSKRLLTNREESQLFEAPTTPPNAHTHLSHSHSTSLTTSGGVAPRHAALHFGPRWEWLKLVWLNRVDVERIDAGELVAQTTRGAGEAPVSAKMVSNAATNAARAGGGTKSDAVASALIAASPVTTSSPTTGDTASSSSLLSRYSLLSTRYGLSNNHDLLSSLISYRYAQGEYSVCLQLCEVVQASDPFLLSIMYEFLGSLHALGHRSRLFFVAHRLVSAYPRRAVSWHAVGVYYLLLRELDVARRFFFKATRLDGVAPYAWVGFGHTFSFQDESEQAIMSYRTAHRLFEGAHVPLLCMGQEYLRTNHLVLARHFLSRARECNPHDPLPLHELGVVHFKGGDMPAAIEAFLHALALVKHEALAQWEPTMFNLGHAYRKMHRYPEAISAYNRALSVSTRSRFSVLCALGFTYHLQGDLASAIAYYHQALGLAPRDAFATDMLDRALNEMANDDVDEAMAMQ